MHIIQPIDNNIFSLKSTLYLQNVNVNIKINLNNKLYPFYPPEIELIDPKVTQPLYFAIINLNITKIKNWNSALSLEWIITNLADKLNPIIDEYIDVSQSFDELENILLKLSNITKEHYSDKLYLDFDILSNKCKTENKSKTWKSGTGYGSNIHEDNWNINNYIKEKEVLQIETCNILKQINNILNENNFKFVKDSCLLRYIINITMGINLLEIENEHLIFNEIIIILSNIKVFDNFKNIINSDFINNIVKNLQPINDEIMLLFQNNNELQNNELYQGLHNIFQTYAELITENVTNNNINVNISNQELYCNVMKPLQFKMNELLSNHKFYDKKNDKPESSAMKRIISEISSFKSGLPLNYESSIWVRISKTNMNLFTFLISGPKDTPYENGLFLFDAYLPHNYPQSEPKVLIITTGGGTVRFNPNLYNSGKVCLSLLGTWPGQESERWNSKTSTFLQVLVSIQSLILIDQPFFNEPGYESEINTSLGQSKSKSYNNIIQYENIKWAMIDQIKNPPHGYEEVVKNHFKLKKDDIINIIDKWNLESNENNKSKMTNEVTNLKELLNNL
jgi:ubiquitin-protein ligase